MDAADSKEEATVVVEVGNVAGDYVVAGYEAVDSVAEDCTEAELPEETLDHRVAG